MKLLMILMLITSVSYAAELGTFGQTFNILEPDLLVEMTAKLNNLVANGKIVEHQQALQQEVVANVKRPKPVGGLSTTKQAKEFWYDPSVKIPYDLTDHQGRVFAVAGTIINPLDFYTFGKAMVFIDGDDVQQATWAVNQAPAVKIILVKGSPFTFMEQYQVPCYFDQAGKLINKLGIKQLPASVSQEGKALKVKEVLLNA